MAFFVARSARDVAGRLGQRNAATTLNVYARFLEQSDRAAADVMGRLIADDGATVMLVIQAQQQVRLQKSELRLRIVASLVSPGRVGSGMIPATSFGDPRQEPHRGRSLREVRPFAVDRGRLQSLSSAGACR
jgi:hypothetical protein